MIQDNYFLLNVNSFLQNKNLAHFHLVRNVQTLKMVSSKFVNSNPSA
jgi:hypothetical protein